MQTPKPADDPTDVALPAGTPAAAVGARPSPLARAGRALRNEIEHLNVRLTLANALAALLPHLCFCRVRTAIYRAAGFRIGPRSLFFGKIHLTGPGRIQDRLVIGADTMVNAHCFFDLSGPITLGDRVSIGHHVHFVTAEHETGPAALRAGPMHPRPIRIEDGSWLAAGVTILPGVTIGCSSIVAAGSMVSGSVPPHRVVGGNPARPLRALPETP